MATRRKKTATYGKHSSTNEDLRCAQNLATAIWKTHYQKDVPGWKPLNTILGVLTQIDNMVAGLQKTQKASAPAHAADCAVVVNGRHDCSCGADDAPHRTQIDSVVRHLADGTIEKRTREILNENGSIWGRTPENIIRSLFYAISEDYHKSGTQRVPDKAPKTKTEPTKQTFKPNGEPYGTYILSIGDRFIEYAFRLAAGSGHSIQSIWEGIRMEFRAYDCNEVRRSNVRVNERAEIIEEPGWKDKLLQGDKELCSTFIISIDDGFVEYAFRLDTDGNTSSIKSIWDRIRKVFDAEDYGGVRRSATRVTGTKLVEDPEWRNQLRLMGHQS